MESKKNSQFYTQEWFIWVMLVFCAPVGIFLMWMYYDELKNGTKTILTIVFIFVFIFMFAMIGATYGSNDDLDNNTGNNSNNSNNTNSNSSETIKKPTVEVADFSTMTPTEIDSWCSEKKVICNITRDYSDTVGEGNFISQSVESSKTIYEGERITIIFSLGKAPTVSQTNALKMAQTYLKYSAFSRQGLIEQLEYEGFSHEDSIYGADNVGADWNEQAVKTAQTYLKYSAFSRKGLIEQLEYEGFTYEQAVYGVEQNGL